MIVFAPYRTCLLVWFVAAQSVWATETLQLRNDPFKPPALTADSRDGVVSTAKLPVVRAVMLSGEYRAANVNGKIVMPGDVVESYKVAAIEDGAVLFTKNEREYRVRVYTSEDAGGVRK
ncbi:hypothetical protein [Litorivivens sp.]|uniref:hypothetical protein n=1 Tax=Litorivivens sp. TaxID=2020868 RepID=UPI0035640691